MIRARVEEATALVDEVMAQRAEDRIGETVTVLVESLDYDADELAAGGGTGRAPGTG